MTILALDTTSEFGSLAIRANGETVAEHALQSPDGFAHLIFQAIQQLLGDARKSLDQIDCFAAASGPGSFTGVRVGLSAVKGLAEAMGKPAVGVSNLRAMSSFGNLPHRAVVLDARRGEVFAAIYNAQLEIVVPEAVLKFSTWLENLVLTSYEFIWMSGAPFRTALEGTRFAETPFVEVPRKLAAAVARCAQIDGQSGNWLDPAALDANYVRRSDAELFWKEP
ncbi:MAG: tRNA (adenosine(37)-N6)-threonylcarbamoyltransferase complex dimerization subunit type 1 TsaB [Bryobacteraceae bacterium]